MAPAASASASADAPPQVSAEPKIKGPLKYSGSLDGYSHFEVTPIIGREYPAANVAEWLRAPNSDELIRDLAITISERGVVFFRRQDEMDGTLQKELITRLGALTTRPPSSGLHIHPVFNSERPDGGRDDEISTISSAQRSAYIDAHFPHVSPESDALSPKKQSTAEWHSDVSFEPVPADYACLRLEVLPPTGGDTVWASGYEVYDMLSGPWQRFAEGLTATFSQHGFEALARAAGFQLYDRPRGSPLNVGARLRAVHPVVRTNPVTGWKSVFPIGGTVSHINGLTAEESEAMVRWFHDLIYRNHQIQARYRWTNKNDFAVWDNRSTYHSATFDYMDLGSRFGTRACGCGEKPYLDPNSKSRREALAEERRAAAASSSKTM